MILPTTLLLGALGYLFYTSKKELSIDHYETVEKQKENDNLQNLSDNSADFIDNAKLLIDNKLGNQVNPVKSTHLNEANQESWDLQNYKKFLSFLKFQEMMDKYNT